MLDPRSNFMIYRLDRGGSCRGGGVCIFVSKDLKSSACCIDQSALSNTVEVVACSILCNKFKITLAVVYLAPNLTKDKYLNSLNVLRCLGLKADHFLLIGDFNLPHIDWSNTLNVHEYKAESLFKFYTDLGLTQLVNESTRINNILDLLFVSDPMLISELTVLPPFGSSDHNSFSFTVCINTDVKRYCVDTRKMFYCWKKADWTLLNDYFLCTDWKLLLSSCVSTNDCWAKFTDVLDQGCKLFVPCNNHKVERKAPRRSKIVRRLMNKKFRFWKKRVANDTVFSRQRYKKVVSELKKQINSEAKQKEMQIIKSGDLGQFFTHVNNRLAHKSGIAPLKDIHGNLITNDEDKANMLNNQFVKAGTLDNNVLPATDVKNLAF